MKIGVTYGCWSGLNVFCVQSLWFMASTIVEFGSICVANVAHFIAMGTSSMSVICAKPCPFH